jgi:nucleoside-diphosphate-sugar epimerase
MKILVAGASGAIGRPLIEKLVRDGHEVVGIANSDEGLKRISDKGAIAVKINALDKHELECLVRDTRPEVVIDELTSLPQNSADMPKAVASDRELRIKGGGHLLEAAVAFGTHQYILQSSGFFYEPGSELASEKESLAVMASPGIAGSARTYTELEKRLSAARIDGIALRYGFLYGPGTWYRPGGGTANQIIGNGDAIWSFVHVEDAAWATVAAINAHPGIYNIVDSDPSPIRQWLPAFARSVGAPPPPTVAEEEALRQTDEDTVYYGTLLRGASNAKARHELGFNPRRLEWLNSDPYGPQSNCG